MEDWVKSSAGGEATDKSFSVKAIKPLWTSKPLPLIQVNPDAPSISSGHVASNSLHSACLASISANFHLFSPDAFSTLPAHLLRRVIHRVSVERRYDYSPTPRTQNRLVEDHDGGDGGGVDEETIEDDGPSHSYRPDVATIWALSTMVDPEVHLPNDEYLNLSSDHILPLPIRETIHALAPQPGSGTTTHPLIELPNEFARYRQSLSLACPSPGGLSSSIPTPLSPNRFELLTTLHIDGIQGNIDDTQLQNLRWCTHLTALWTKKCDISDYGIRLLASSLELPGPAGPTGSGPSYQSAKETHDRDRGRGLRRLRAWFLSGCGKVTDHSLKSFARWPGLVLLDIRDTSCTSASRQIFNAQSSLLFSRRNPAFQPCTTGLKSLFSQRSTPAQILDALCSTLIKPRPSLQEDTPTEAGPSRWWLGLHVVSTMQPLRPEWLPDPPSTDVPENADLAGYDKYSQSRTYRGDGVGQIYGQGVWKMHDRSSQYRRDVKIALKMQAAEEGLIKLDKPDWKSLDYKKRKYERSSKYDGVGGISKYGRRTIAQSGKTQKELKGWKPKKGETWDESTDSSRAFVMGVKGTKAPTGPDVITGNKELMLIRMVCDDWEDLTWKTAAVRSTQGQGNSVGIKRLRMGAAPSSQSGSSADPFGWLNPAVSSQRSMSQSASSTESPFGSHPSSQASSSAHSLGSRSSATQSGSSAGRRSNPFAPVTQRQRQQQQKEREEKERERQEEERRQEKEDERQWQLHLSWHRQQQESQAQILRAQEEIRQRAQQRRREEEARGPSWLAGLDTNLSQRIPKAEKPSESIVDRRYGLEGAQHDLEPSRARARPGSGPSTSTSTSRPPGEDPPLIWDGEDDPPPEFFLAAASMDMGTGQSSSDPHDGPSWSEPLTPPASSSSPGVVRRELDFSEAVPVSVERCVKQVATDGFETFSAVPSKRRFGGKDQGEKRRRGMKMFSRPKIS